MARYALGTFPYAEATLALIKALDKTSGYVKAGIINTLAQRGAMAQRGAKTAVPDLISLVTSHDRVVSTAAIRALGRIGGREALSCLLNLRGKALPRELALERDNALLSCAEKLLRQGKKEQARKIYRIFFEGAKERHIKLAGLRGLITCGEKEAAGILKEAILKGDGEFRREALRFVTLLGGRRASALSKKLISNYIIIFMLL